MPSSLALYPRLLGDSWTLLSPLIQYFFGCEPVARGTGTFVVSGGGSWLAGVLAAASNLPRPAEDLPVRLVVHRDTRGETWNRTFAGKPMVTQQRELPGGCLGERIGPVEIVFRLEVDQGLLRFRQVGAAVCVAGLRLPIPKGIAPSVDARVWMDEANDCVHTRVTVTAPIAGLLVRYEGYLRQEAPDPIGR